MMNIIATAKSMDKISEYVDDLNDASVIFILYEADETISVADLAKAYDTHAKLVFICTASRDDKLLCVGGIKVRLDCVTLDSELECSSEILNKINGVFGNNRMSGKTPEFVMNTQRSRPSSSTSSIQEVL